MTGPHTWASNRRKPGLYRTAASASLYLFLAYVATGMAFTPLTVLFVQRACEQNGLDKEHCKSTVDGVDNPAYNDAQKKAAQNSVLYTLLTGVPPLITCAFFGCVGDAFGRRIPLVMPLIGGIPSGIAFAATSSSSAAILICAPFAFAGGAYVSNLSAFSSLADVTKHSTPKERAVAFSLVESAIWIGLLIGPFVGGMLADAVGPQKCFWITASVGVLNLLVVLLTYPETLEHDQRRPFSWRRANPFASIHMFFQTRTTLLLGLILLLSLTAQSGGLGNISLYALKVCPGIAPTMLGLLQSTVLGSAVIGLMIIMPCIVRCVSLARIVVMSCLSGGFAYLLFSVVSQEWQFFAVGSGLFFAGCYFPVVRCGMTNTFGKERYGESLAAVGVIEQLCNLIGSPIINGVYTATESVEFSIGSISVRSIAMLTAAGMYLTAAVLATFLPHVPHEDAKEVGDVGSFVATGSLISDCQEGGVGGRPRLT